MIEKHFGFILAFLVAFDFGFMGYDIRLALDGTWWCSILAGFMAFYGLRALGGYKKHHEQIADNAATKKVYSAWGDSIGQRYARRDEVVDKELLS